MQPLVAAGRRAPRKLVEFRMVDPDHFVLAQEIWGGGVWESGELAVPPGREGKLRVRLGEALGIDPRSPLGSLSHALVVWLDQTPVWWRNTSWRRSRTSAPIPRSQSRRMTSGLPP